MMRTREGNDYKRPPFPANPRTDERPASRSARHEFPAIGQIGNSNELSLIGALCGAETGLEIAGQPHRNRAAQAAPVFLARHSLYRQRERTAAE